MEILFENKHARDRQWAKDFYGYIFFRRPYMMFLHILCVIGFVVNIGLMVANREYLIADGEINIPSSVIILLFYFLIVIVRYFRCINLEMKRTQEMYGKPVEVELFITDEKITTKLSTGAEVDLLFENVKKVFNTKKYIYLQTQTKLLMCFKKDSFTLGSSEEFLEFLKDKGFKVK